MPYLNHGCVQCLIFIFRSEFCMLLITLLEMIKSLLAQCGVKSYSRHFYFPSFSFLFGQQAYPHIVRPSYTDVHSSCYGCVWKTISGRYRLFCLCGCVWVGLTRREELQNTTDDIAGVRFDLCANAIVYVFCSKIHRIKHICIIEYIFWK